MVTVGTRLYNCGNDHFKGAIRGSNRILGVRRLCRADKLGVERIAMNWSVEISFLTALFAATGAIISQPPLCTHPDICAPRIITTCPNKNPIASCPSCCCNSTENVEFYNPDKPEPRCMAPPAAYTVRFVGTWSRSCQPDYYFSNAHWSPPTGASHNTSYQMWDACMDNPSLGVALVSQTGSTTLIEREYRDAGDSILDTFKAGLINGAGRTSRDLDVDKDHQWASVVTMLAPSMDRMAGVADLRLCDGHDWKRYVKVCAELFSTATRTERFHPPMERNTIQWNNCSFGYFEFTFKDYKDSSQASPQNCEFESHGVCPPGEHIPKRCRTCCCLSSDNVEFSHPDVPNNPCGVDEIAAYKVSLISEYSSSCHPNFPVPADFGTPYFSGLVIASHSQNARAYDRCQIPSDTLFNFVNNHENVRPLLRAEAAQGLLYSYYLGNNAFSRRKGRKRVGYIHISPDAPAVSVVSKLIPSSNLFAGVSGLNLCGGSGWKDRVEVCVELLEATNTSDAELAVQGNQCSFGRYIFEFKFNLPNPNGKKRRGIEEPSCTPLNGSVSTDDTCCFFEFIIDGKIIRSQSRLHDPKYSHTLVVKVEAVHYDDISHIQPGDVVEIKICSLSGRIKRNSVYRLSGSRECGSNELEISEYGILAERPLEAPCASFILGGGCDDLRS